MGIEPTLSAWEADVLPLNYTCIKPLKLAARKPRKTNYNVISIAYFPKKSSIFLLLLDKDQYRFAGQALLQVRARGKSP